MHRSVFEFLNNPGVWDLDCLYIDDAAFEASAALSKMNLHLLYISAVQEESRFSIFPNNLQSRQKWRVNVCCVPSIRIQHSAKLLLELCSMHPSSYSKS